MNKQYSIIIPTHNGASHGLGVLLHSITTQCYDRSRFEVIVICDKCTDNTHELAEKYADIVEDADFGNAGLSRSMGLDLASGEWVLFADDDDDWIGRYVFETLDRLSGDYDILIFGFRFGDRGIAMPFDNAGNIFPNVWSKMWRRSFIGETRFKEVYPNDDEVFCQDILAKNPRIRVSEAVLYDYNYMRPGSITDTERKRNASEE